MANIVIFGGSSGLGNALSVGLPNQGDHIWLVNRRRPLSLDLQDGVHRSWIDCDLSTPASIDLVAGRIVGIALDTLIYCSGTWESAAIDRITAAECYSVISVNLSGFVASVAALATNLRESGNAKVIAIGSTAGLENATGPRAAYAASKFGLRGAVHSLRAFLRPDGISVTCISPGGIASDVPFDSGEAEALSRHSARRIPVSDIVALIRSIIRMSRATCLKEIVMPAMFDLDV